MKNQNSQLLTGFEIGYNLTLILLVIIVLNFTGDIVEHSKLILAVVFFMRVFPMNFSPNITIFAKKYANLIVQSIVLIVIYLNKEKFVYNGNGMEFSIFCFVYFNIMRLFGELYVGKDPIWLGHKAIGRYSNSKGRKNTKIDSNWLVVYYIVLGIIILLYANRRWVF